MNRFTSRKGCNDGFDRFHQDFIVGPVPYGSNDSRESEIGGNSRSDDEIIAGEFLFECRPFVCCLGNFRYGRCHNHVAAVARDRFQAEEGKRAVDVGKLPEPLINLLKPFQGRFGEYVTGLHDNHDHIASSKNLIDFVGVYFGRHV